MNIERAAKLAELAGDTVIGISVACFGVLLTLKLIDKIDWSWWAILAPVYGGIPAGFVITIGTIVILVLHERATDNTGSSQ